MKYQVSRVVAGPLLRPALATSWLIAVLCWFAEDNGVTVAAFAAPFVLPLVIAIVCAPAVVTGLPAPPAAPAAPGRSAPGTRAGHDQAGQAGHPTDAGTASGGQPGYR